MCSKLVFGIILCSLWAVIAADTFSQQCLEAHNTYRAKHQAPPLTLDSTVQAFSQKWANHLASTGNFQHSTGSGYGENLYASFGNSNINGYTPVKAWYDEIQYYDFNNPGFAMNTGHFTQVVWKNSKKLGCAIAKNGNKAYVVANYSPPGNYQGQFKENVLPAK